MAHYRLIIRNATVYDGTGAPPKQADLAVQDDRIAIIGDIEGVSAEQEIDASGQAVAPGFIDVHTHDDFAAIFHADMAFKFMGGVTTSIVGNCGMGAAPYPEAMRMSRAFHPNHSLPEYHGYHGYMDYLEAHPPGINIGVLMGHGTIRAAAMGRKQDVPDDREMAAMKTLVHEGLDAGTLGLSTGLIYDPGRYAQTDEITELAGEMYGTGALYTTHMRNEGPDLLDSIRESMRIGERAGVPVQISHHKVTGRENWGMVAESLRLIEQAQANGQDIHADQYPYTAGSTILSAVMQNGRFDEAASDGSMGRLYPEDVVIAAAANKAEWEGKSIATLAQELGKPPQEAAEAVLREEPGATVVMHTMNEDDVQTIMQHNSTMIGSDGLPTLEGKPHPRLYGTFARVLGHYSRDLSLFSLEEAIYRMTGFSASKFGLSERGVLSEGAFADLVIFDPSEIKDQGTFEDPNHYPIGINHVFVNGVQVKHDGSPIEQRAGKVLRRMDV
ncbi:MAG: D-aminoacylase [Pseudomonadota bacterium]